MFMRAEDVVALLKVSRPTLYAYVSRGLIRAEVDAEDPRRRLYRADDVERLIKAKSRGRAPGQVAAATLDFGLPVLESQITLIDGGRLFYRGRDAVALAGKAGLEEAARLLWAAGEDDPFATPPVALPPAWAGVSASLRPATPVQRCLALLPLIESAGAGESRRDLAMAAALLRQVAAAAAGAEPSGRPIHRHLAEIWSLDWPAAELLRLALVLTADHELNASTFAVRVVASTGASLAACVIGGLAALGGPRHGGATHAVEALLDEIERTGDATAVAQRRVDRGEKLPGFGHPLYPEGDMRARAIRARLPFDAGREAMLETLERLAGRPANLDAMLVILRRALRLPPGAAQAIFAAGRTAGWLAHALEQQAAGQLIRPRARYAGPPPAAALTPP